MVLVTRRADWGHSAFQAHTRSGIFPLASDRPGFFGSREGLMAIQGGIQAEMSLEEEKGRLHSKQPFLAASHYFPEAPGDLSLVVRTVVSHELVFSRLTGVRGSAITISSTKACSLYGNHPRICTLRFSVSVTRLNMASDKAPQWMFSANSGL